MPHHDIDFFLVVWQIPRADWRSIGGGKCYLFKFGHSESCRSVSDSAVRRTSRCTYNYSRQKIRDKAKDESCDQHKHNQHEPFHHPPESSAWTRLRVYGLNHLDLA